MEIHKPGGRSHRQVLVLLSIFSGVGPAFLFYLLLLQAPVVSGFRIGLAALAVPLFAIPTWRVLSRSRGWSWKTLFWMALAAFFLALLGVSALSFYGEKLYLFYGRHTLTLLPRSGSVELRGLSTSLGPVSYADLDGSDRWGRQGNTLFSRSSGPAPLRWVGWSGDSIRLDVAGDPGARLQVAWDGAVQEYQLGEPDGKPTAIKQSFSMPFVGSLLLFLILWLTLIYVAFHFFVFFSSSQALGPLRPHGLVLSIFLILAAVLLGALLIGIYLPVHPAFAFPDRDSGFFMYAGRKVLEGSIPYRDFWDHKGPLVYYLNALGLFLGGNSAAGVWGFELAWVAVATACLFFLLRGIGGDISALIGSAVFLLGLGDALGGGNFTEEYALLFIILMFLLFRLYLASGKNIWLAASGLMAGGAFLLRANQISGAVGVTVYLLALALQDRFSRPRVLALLGFLAGAAAPLLLYSIYLAGHHALADMYSQVIVYNRIYSGQLHWGILEDFRRGLSGFPWLGFWIIAGLAALLPRFIASRERPRKDPFAAVLVISAAAELYFSNLSPAGYKHYYITWLPYAAGLAAYFSSAILTLLGPGPLRWRSSFSNLLYAGAILAAVWFARIPLGSLQPAWRELQAQERPAWDTGNHPLNGLRDFTAAQSTLVMWGNEAEYNFLLRLDSPTRFVYQYPLMNPAYASEAMVREFVADLETSLPVIVDASSGNTDSLPLEPIRRAELLAQPGAAARYRYLQPLYDFIDARYRSVGNISKNWVVLLPVPPR